MPLGLVATLCLALSQNQGTDPARVVAKVNGHPITVGDITPSLWEWYSSPIIQDFVINRVIEDEAKKLKLTVTPAEIDQMVSGQLEQLKSRLPEGKSLDQFLMEQGSPKTKLAFRARSEILLTKIASQSFRAADFVNVSTLLIRAKSSDLTEVSKAIEKANKAYANLKKGDTWLKVLGEFSSDPSVLNTQGRLGWRLYEMFPESTQQELKTLKPKGYTKPVQTINGFQIFRLEYRGNEASEGEQALLRDQVVTSNKKKVLDQLLKEAKIERF